MNFQPFHHDMSILRGCHYSIKKTKQWNIFCAFTHGWLDTGGESTNSTFPYTAPELPHVDFSFSQSGPSRIFVFLTVRMPQERRPTGICPGAPSLQHLHL